MKKNLLIIIFLIIAAVAVLATFLLFYKKSGKVCFENNCFNVEIADNYSTLTKGLMYRKDLPKNQGMLFIFPKEDIYSFWMKNTLIPLDIIWINQNKKVVFISKNNQLCENNSCPSINPGVEAKYVLEINAGLSEELGIKISDKADIK